MNAPRTAAATAPAKQSFAALRHAGFRAQFITYVLAMMADNIEHVISYWVVFQKFQSPALAGFAVVSHWLPFLLFSVAAGALADRLDPRRIIQCGMMLFIVASLGWGYFFITENLHAPASDYGLLGADFGVGAVVGAVLVAIIGSISYIRAGHFDCLGNFADGQGQVHLCLRTDCQRHFGLRSLESRSGNRRLLDVDVFSIGVL